MYAKPGFRWSVLALIVSAVALTGCNSVSLREQNQRLKNQNIEAQATLDRTRAALEAAEADRANLSAEVTRLQGELDQAYSKLPAQSVPQPTPAAKQADTGFGGIKDVDVERGAGKITLRIPGDVLFAPGKIALRPTALDSLNKIAAVIKKDYNTKTIRVEGYADVDPIKKSGWDDNLELSAERSMAVFRHLAKQGVNPVRMYAAGFGDYHPKSSKAASRRVEIVVVLTPEG